MPGGSFHYSGDALDVGDPYALELDAVVRRIRSEFGLTMASGMARTRVRVPLPDPLASGWRPRRCSAYVAVFMPERDVPMRPRQVLALMRDVFLYEVCKAAGRPRSRSVEYVPRSALLASAHFARLV